MYFFKLLKIVLTVLLFLKCFYISKTINSPFLIPSRRSSTLTANFFGISIGTGLPENISLKGLFTKNSTFLQQIPHGERRERGSGKGEGKKITKLFFIIKIFSRAKENYLCRFMKSLP